MDKKNKHTKNILIVVDNENENEKYSEGDIGIIEKILSIPSSGGGVDVFNMTVIRDIRHGALNSLNYREDGTFEDGIFYPK